MSAFVKKAMELGRECAHKATTVNWHALRAHLEARDAVTRQLAEALKALVQNEGLKEYQYLDRGVGTATSAGQRWLSARTAIQAYDEANKS